jgi:hypothetical protein
MMWSSGGGSRACSGEGKEVRTRRMVLFVLVAGTRTIRVRRVSGDSMCRREPEAVLSATQR